MERHYVLSEDVARKLAVLLGRTHRQERDVRPSRGGSVGRLPLIVRCTSATAIGGDDIGDQSYSAVVVEANAEEDTQPELGEVWLTVLGDNAVAETPTVDALYHGLLSGDYDPDPGGAGTDNRPRVFATATGASSGTAGACAGGCGSLLSAADHADVAFALEVLCNTGSFDHATFAEDFDDVSLAGAQFRRSGAATWTLLYWSVSLETWVPWELNTGTVAGSVVLTFDATDTGNHGMPILRVDGVALRTTCDERDAVFRGGPRNGFTGAGSVPTPGGCLPDDFTLRVPCTCLWPDGWTGPGYYPTAETDCEAECLAVLIEDPCAFTGIICGPRFDTLAEAETWCEGFPLCATAPASMTYVVVSDGCLNGHTDTLNETIGNEEWADNNSPSPCGTDVGFVLECDADVWTATYNGEPLTLTGETPTTLTFTYVPVSPVTGTTATFTVSI